MQAQKPAFAVVGTHVHPTGEGGEENVSTVRSMSQRNICCTSAGFTTYTGMEPVTVRKKQPPVFGTSATNRTVKSVDTVRTVDIFVSRLDPATAESDLVDWVKSAKGNVNITDIQCQELQSKTPSIKNCTRHSTLQCPSAPHSSRLLWTCFCHRKHGQWVCLLKGTSKHVMAATMPRLSLSTSYTVWQKCLSIT